MGPAGHGRELLNWTYLGDEVTAEVVDGYFGFVYIVTCVPTKKRYVGKKLLTRARSRGPLKGRVRKRRDRVESDWKDYYGSNKELQADVERLGPDKFRREIIHLCETRGECSYWEAYEQFNRSVLKYPDEWYNQQIHVRVHRTHLRKK